MSKERLIDVFECNECRQHGASRTILVKEIENGILKRLVKILPIGLAVLLTVANFETPSPTGQLVQSAMVTGFGCAF